MADNEAWVMQATVPVGTAEIVIRGYTPRFVLTLLEELAENNHRLTRAVTKIQEK